jgi:hypothetical protein
LLLMCVSADPNPDTPDALSIPSDLRLLVVDSVSSATNVLLEISRWLEQTEQRDGLRLVAVDAEWQPRRSKREQCERDGVGSLNSRVVASRALSLLQLVLEGQCIVVIDFVELSALPSSSSSSSSSSVDGSCHQALANECGDSDAAAPPLRTGQTPKRLADEQHEVQCTLLHRVLSRVLGLFAHDQVVVAGFSLQQDLRRLASEARAPVTVAHSLELQEVVPALRASAGRLGVAEWLRVCVVAGLNKSEQCSDWEVRPLTQSQVCTFVGGQVCLYWKYRPAS